jgi:hypothetical protein
VQLPRVFLIHTRHTDHAPHAPLAAVVPHEQMQQPLEIEAIRLGPACTTIDLDARRIDDVIAHPVRDQPPVQPERLPARFITAHNRRRRRQVESDFRPRDFLQDSIGGTRGNLPEAGPLPGARREADLPDAFAELERDQQRRAPGRDCCTLLSAGHGHHRYAPLRVVFQGSVTT